ncbi:hypothetical protein LAZ67_2003763 [Cordylochernes scorpioides]|uniref:Transposase n=1 Tax=Cordylochernes scorpioides TaxID=51811 RepID=A0ABY6K7T9_9ARAC|nr:hypothetical protein LAZ67_2003763 [Cordylochernes scorpioides]
MTFWRLERINGSSIVLYGEICFEIRIIQDTSKVAERIKLVCRELRIPNIFGDLAIYRYRYFRMEAEVNYPYLQEKARMFKSKLKCLLITFFYVKGLVHYEFVPECQTINQHYYLDVLRRLREPARQKRPEKWHQKNWLLHHDNARPHTAVTVPLYLSKHGIALLPQPPYSPDFLPTIFSFTLKLKES